MYNTIDNGFGKEIPDASTASIVKVYFPWVAVVEIMRFAPLFESQLGEPVRVKVRLSKLEGMEDGLQATLFARLNVVLVVVGV
jgi:hypothetical protein